MINFVNHTTKNMGKKVKFAPLKSYKPITNERHARKATSDFHGGGGDRATYQAASALLTDLHKTSSKFVFRSVTKLNLRPKQSEPKLETLEVGAVNAQLLRSPFLKVRAIDIKSRIPGVEELDFFLLDPHDAKKYDLVVLAMVLNCVDTKEKRGIMLKNCRMLTKPGGLFFLILPARCFPHDTRDKFERKVMDKLGFEVVFKESTPKVVSTCFRASGDMAQNQLVKFSDGPRALLDIELQL